MRKIKFKWKRKYWIAVFFTVAGATAVGVYFALQDSQGRKTNTSNQTNSTSNVDFGVFPELKTQDFYKYIRVNDGVPFINEDMIAQLANYVLSKITINAGSMQWNFKFLDEKRQQLLLRFVWTPPKGNLAAVQSHDYHIVVHD